jgi:hypothetical protein
MAMAAGRIAVQHHHSNQVFDVQNHVCHCVPPNAIFSLLLTYSKDLRETPH